MENHDFEAGLPLTAAAANVFVLFWGANTCIKFVEVWKTKP